MASKPDDTGVVSIDLSVVDRNWIRKSLELQRTSIVRGKNKEMDGSPVRALRDSECAQINSILAKLS